MIIKNGPQQSALITKIGKKYFLASERSMDSIPNINLENEFTRLFNNLTKALKNKNKQQVIKIITVHNNKLM